MKNLQSNTHILAINTEESVGVAVKSVKFSIDVRVAVYSFATTLLSELDYTNLDKYLSIRVVAQMFNECEDYVCAKTVRNAIRAIDMRIQLCENKKVRFEMSPKGLSSYTGLFCPEQQIYYVAEKHPGIIKPCYNGSTMFSMKAIRQILVDSLIIITPEFE